MDAVIPRERVLVGDHSSGGEISEVVKGFCFYRGLEDKTSGALVSTDATVPMFQSRR